SYSTWSQQGKIIIVGLETLSRKLVLSQSDPGGGGGGGTGSGEVTDSKQAEKRHNGRLNITFGDAHVELVSAQKLLLDLSPQWLRKWHLDNEPHSDFFP